MLEPTIPAPMITTSAVEDMSLDSTRQHGTTEDTGGMATYQSTYQSPRHTPSNVIRSCDSSHTGTIGGTNVTALLSAGRPDRRLAGGHRHERRRIRRPGRYRHRDYRCAHRRTCTWLAGLRRRRIDRIHLYRLYWRDHFDFYRQDDQTRIASAGPVSLLRYRARYRPTLPAIGGE